MAILNPLLLKRAICEAQLYVLTDIKTLSLMKNFWLKSLIFSQKTSATKLKRNYVFASNLFFPSISYLHQDSLFSLAEDLKWKWNTIHLISEFASNNCLQIFYLKKSSTKQDKKLTSPFALKEIFVYLCRDRIDIRVVEHAGEQVIMQAVIRLFTSTAVNLTERLKVLQRLLSWIFRYFKAGDKTLPPKLCLCVATQLWNVSR